MSMEYKPELLLVQKRNGLVELEFYGFIVICDKNKNIKTIGNTNNYPFFQRSCAKPMQASVISDFGTRDYYNLSLEEIAICCGSHTGEPVHVDILRKLLKKGGFGEQDLQCPAIEPLNKNEQRKYTTYSPLHNNCSGKHTLMLLICKQMGWDTKTYLEFDHPLQKYIYKKIRNLCEEKKELSGTRDGCNAPVWAVALESQCVGFLNLFTDKKNINIKNAFLEYPYMIGGEYRQDTDIITYTDGIVAKTGAGGLLMLLNLYTCESVMIKIIDADMRARAFVAIELIKQLNWCNSNSINKLLNIYPDVVTTETGIVVGELEPCFSL